MIRFLLLCLFLGISLQAEILDVAIIGGGQSGMGIGLALQKRKIFNFAIFDKAPKGLEGQWLITARMPVLRSKKTGLSGPSLDNPRLAFQTWYEEEKGDWDCLGDVPTPLWAEYLQWYRNVLDLPIRNGMNLLSIIPENGSFKLLFQGGEEIRAKKVVLATGRDGCGGLDIPDSVADLPKHLYYHAGERIDSSLFRRRKICVIGGGSSAFDAAGCALESGAERVELLFRKDEIPTINHLALYNKWDTYYFLSDAEKMQLYQLDFDGGTPPGDESIGRLDGYQNFHLHCNTWVKEISSNEKIHIQTNQGLFEADLLILATGYKVDLFSVPEISLFADQILLWGDKIQGILPCFAPFPYLGPHFEFLEKIPASAPFLKDIHCFNYGAFLSQGRVSGDIDQIAIGLERLAEGIAAELSQKKDLDMELTIAIGSKNRVKIDAVKEVFQQYPDLSQSNFVPISVPSEIADQPLTIEETIRGAKNRAKNAFSACNCKYSVGIESGLFEAPGTQTGFLNVSVCCIYNGEDFHIGLSSGFEVPPQVLDLVRNQNMDLSQACFHSGITDDEHIGIGEGLIGILTKGRIDRKEYTKQSIITALIQLENSQLYDREPDNL